MNYTPGPWKATLNPDTKWYDISAAPQLDKGFRGMVRWTLAMVTEISPHASTGEQVANARLIAAAPALVEALADLTHYFEPLEAGEVVFTQLPGLRKQVENARVALALAKGEK